MAEERKPKTFIIEHKKTKSQRREFEHLSVPLRYLPESLSLISADCPFCRTLFQPSWLEKQELSMTPVKPKWEARGVEYTGPKRWILHQVSQKCPKCNADVMIALPVKKMRTKGSLFGDDAERSCQNKKVSIYSLVGADQSLLPELKDRIKDVKQYLLPSIPYNTWKIHMKTMWSGTSREKHPIYRNLSFKDVLGFADKILELIKRRNLFIYNIAVTSVMNLPSDRTLQQSLRDEAYILLVLNAIDEWTEKDAQPSIFFDSEKRSKANETIHGWARAIFKGSQYSLLYGFLSKGIEIHEPTFVPPASFPELELADFVSFTIGRYYFRMWQGKDIEIDPKGFGLVTYLGYANNGDLLRRRQEGYPWDEFHH